MTNKFNLEEQNLNVDWITLTITGSINMEAFMHDFHVYLKFNCFHFGNKKNYNFYKQGNKAELFLKKNRYNNISFSGKNAAYFYIIIKNNVVKWENYGKFTISLTRLNISFFRKNKPSAPNVGLKLKNRIQKLTVKNKINTIKLFN